METGTGHSAPEQAKEKAADVGQQAKEQARGRLSGVVDQRSTMAGEQVNSTAQALRQTSSQLRAQGKEGPAKAMDTVAERIEGAGSWLRDTNGDAMLRDVESAARRNPVPLMLGGLTLGFAASRLLRASSAARFRSSDAGRDYDSTYGGGYTSGGYSAGGYTSGGGSGTGYGDGQTTDLPAGGGTSVPDVDAPGALSGSPTSGLTAEGGSTSAPTSRMGLSDLEADRSTVGGEGEGFTPPRGA